jgi:4-hydroxy-2-oxoheptanedioate aldolase
MTRDWAADYRRANEDVLVFGLIEDPEGVENVEAIAAGSGLDGLLFGPFDLAMTLGLEGDVTHPDLAVMSARLIDATRAARIEYVSILGWEFDGIDGLARSGSRIVTVTGDRGALANSFQGALEKSRTRLDRAAQELTA